MTHDELKESARLLFERSFDMLFKKNAEYSGTTHDALGNFRRGAEMVGVQPETITMIYASKHWDSISSYIKSIQAGKPNQALTEPMQGRIIDLINYMVFLNALLEERAKK